MSKVKSIILDLPEADFKKIVSGLDGDNALQLARAFADAERDMRVNVLYSNAATLGFAPGFIVGMSEQIASMGGAYVVLNATGTVSLHMQENTFQDIANTLAPEEKKSMTDAFSAAVTSLARKEERHPLFAIFGRNKDTGEARIANRKGAMLYVVGKDK